MQQNNVCVLSIEKYSAYAQIFVANADGVDTFRVVIAVSLQYHRSTTAHAACAFVVPQQHAFAPRFKCCPLRRYAQQRMTMAILL